jgi:hypothetical protein
MLWAMCQGGSLVVFIGHADEPAMSDRDIGAKKAVVALVAAGAVIGALVLVFLAAFPYLYAESGSPRYAREHRGEAMLQLLAAAALACIAWRCIRGSFSTRTWMKVVAILVVTSSLSSLTKYTRRPANARPIGGNWHVVTKPQPGEIDTIFYSLYYKRGPRYQPVQDLVGEYRFVPPDCVTYRGLKVVGRPMHAMCGHRTPVETYDTTTAESELLSKARAQPPFGRF